MPRAIKEDLAHLIRRVVKEKKLKLRDVEYKSGGQIAQSYVSRLMTGNVKNLTVEKLIALARGLEIDPHEVFTAAHGHPPQSAFEPRVIEETGALEFATLMQSVAANANLMEIMKGANQLGDEECKSVLRYIAALRNRKRSTPRNRKKPQSDTADS
jgi:transcriptional regulator with XRE-family HTH domain